MPFLMWQKSGFETTLNNGLFVYEVVTTLRATEKSEMSPDISQAIDDISKAWERGEEVSMRELDKVLDEADSKEELVPIIRNLVMQNLKLKETSLKDPLTQLDNRRALEEKLTATMSRLRRQKPPGKLAVFMIDGDRFKNINDTLGHSIGDVALREMAQIMKNSLRGEDILARYGGEEFVAAIETNEENAEKVAEKLRVAVEENLKNWMKIHCENEDQKKLVDGIAGTISIGISFYDAEKNPGMSMKELIDQADMGLYEAKKTRNTWVVCKPKENADEGVVKEGVIA
jgi:diguanylate cyclase (GGDEF)-like protein